MYSNLIVSATNEHFQSLMSDLGTIYQITSDHRFQKNALTTQLFTKSFYYVDALLVSFICFILVLLLEVEQYIRAPFTVMTINVTALNKVGHVIIIVYILLMGKRQGRSETR